MCYFYMCVRHLVCRYSTCVGVRVCQNSTPLFRVYVGMRKQASSYCNFLFFSCYGNVSLNFWRCNCRPAKIFEVRFELIVNLFACAKLKQFASSIPHTISTLEKLPGINHQKYKSFVMCQKCSCIYEWDEGWIVGCGSGVWQRFSLTKYCLRMPASEGIPPTLCDFQCLGFKHWQFVGQLPGRPCGTLHTQWMHSRQGSWQGELLHR